MESGWIVFEGMDDNLCMHCMLEIREVPGN